MKNDLLLILVSLLTGALIPIQATSNAALSKAVGNPVVTAFLVLLLALVSVFVYLLLSRTTIPTWAAFRTSPTYGYVGGWIVAFYIVVITFITPRLGVGASIGLIITGQLLGAVAIDHFGLFDTVKRSIDFNRLTGTLFMIAGIYLVMKK